jgi:hypothetical protein
LIFAPSLSRMLFATAVPSIFCPAMVNLVLEKLLLAGLSAVYSWRGLAEHHKFLGGVAPACGKQRARTPTRPPQIGCTFIILLVRGPGCESFPSPGDGRDKTIQSLSIYGMTQSGVCSSILNPGKRRRHADAKVSAPRLACVLLRIIKGYSLRWGKPPPHEYASVPPQSEPLLWNYGAL